MGIYVQPMVGKSGIMLSHLGISIAGQISPIEMIARNKSCTVRLC